MRKPTEYLLCANLRRLFDIFYKANKDNYSWAFWNRQAEPESGINFLYKDQRIIAFILFSAYLQNQFDLYVNRTYFQALKTRLIPSHLDKPSLLLDFLRLQVTLSKNHENELSRWRTNYTKPVPEKHPEQIDDEERRRITPRPIKSLANKSPANRTKMTKDDC